MNRPVSKEEIGSLRKGETLRTQFPNRRRRRKTLTSGNNRKINRARKRSHITVNSYDYIIKTFWINPKEMAKAVDSPDSLAIKKKVKVKSSKKFVKFFRLIGVV